MDLFSFDAGQLMSFILTFMRISLIVFLLPFFGGQTIPMQVKGALTIVLTLAVWPGNAISPEYFPAHPAELIVLMLGELLLGLMMGLMVEFVFVGAQLGGQIIGFQMGFSMISMADPSSGDQLIVTSFLIQTVALTLFLVMDGHLFLLSGLMNSFKLVPPGSLFIGGRLASDMLTLSAEMFVIALKIAGPVVVCLFMVDLALALMARAAPQMNLLMIGFPIKIAVGLVLMGILFTLLSMYLEDFLRTIGPMFNNLMRMSTGAG